MYMASVSHSGDERDIIVLKPDTLYGKLLAHSPIVGVSTVAWRDAPNTDTNNTAVLSLLTMATMCCQRYSTDLTV